MFWRIATCSITADINTHVLWSAVAQAVQYGSSFRERSHFVHARFCFLAVVHFVEFLVCGFCGPRPLSLVGRPCTTQSCDVFSFGGGVAVVRSGPLQERTCAGARWQVVNSVRAPAFQCWEAHMQSFVGLSGCGMSGATLGVKNHFVSSVATSHSWAPQVAVVRSLCALAGMDRSQRGRRIGDPHGGPRGGVTEVFPLPIKAVGFSVDGRVPLSADLIQVFVRGGRFGELREDSSSAQCRTRGSLFLPEASLVAGKASRLAIRRRSSPTKSKKELQLLMRSSPPPPPSLPPHRPVTSVQCLSQQLLAPSAQGRGIVARPLPLAQSAAKTPLAGVVQGHPSSNTSHQVLDGQPGFGPPCELSPKGQHLSLRPLESFIFPSRGGSRGPAGTTKLREQTWHSPPRAQNGEECAGMLSGGSGADDRLGHRALAGLRPGEQEGTTGTPSGVIRVRS